MTEYAKETIKQTRGPRIEFGGRLLCEDDSGPVHMEVWETKGGALVAVTSANMHDGRDGLDVRAKVVNRGWCSTVNAEMDQQIMRFAVMDHFNWDNRARSMVKKIGWKLVQEVA